MTMPTLTLKDRTVTLDEQDAYLLTAHRWTIRRVTHADGHAYESVAACKSVGPRGAVVRTIVYLHKLILGDNPPRMQPAWRDGDRLNCSRGNLYWRPVGEHLQVKAGTTRYPCPFGPSRLEELHWREGQTLEEIGKAAQEIAGWDRAPSPEIVKRWLKAAGVRNRSLSEVVSLRNQSDLQAATGLYSEEAKASGAQAAKARHAPVLIAGRIVTPARRGWKHTAATKRKQSQIAKARTDRPDSRVTLICQACGVSFKVYPSQAEGRKYCQKLCPGRGKRRKETEQ